ncbi:hypothetical protein AWZ03_003077 [Drosophila navojoa]|uniref:Uncharacterized protein n=1 Tax=Drosophila navojoa TaxID=7232 RepID=A0A484BP09_DRONA|nr:hypothetical protein AWZ03_003077 [Drosophila navojoa]
MGAQKLVSGAPANSPPPHKLVAIVSNLIALKTLASLYSIRTVRRGRCPAVAVGFVSLAVRLRSASSSRGYNCVRFEVPLMVEVGASPGVST